MNFQEMMMGKLRAMAGMSTGLPMPQAPPTPGTTVGATGTWEAPVAKPEPFEYIPDPPAQTSAGVAGAAPAAAPTPGMQPGMDPQWLELAQAQEARERAVLGGSMGLAGLDDERALLQDQMAVADELRNSELGPMRQAGRVSVASNPLEAVAVLGEKYYGNKERKRVTEETKGLNKRRQESLQRLMEAIAGQTREEPPSYPMGGGQ